MLNISKTADPIPHVKFKKEVNPKNWNSYEFDIKRQLKSHMLDNEQEGYCPYCERQIDIDDSHIEHIEPKHKASKYKDYNNMLTSCNNPKTCGHAKKGKFSNDFLNPVLVEPMDFLKYKFETGEIIPVEKDQFHSNHQKAMETIDTLKLNEKGLLASRKRFNIEIGIMEENMNEKDLKLYLEGCLSDKLNFKTLIESYL